MKKKKKKKSSRIYLESVNPIYRPSFSMNEISVRKRELLKKNKRRVLLKKNFWFVF